METIYKTSYDFSEANKAIIRAAQLRFNVHSMTIQNIPGYPTCFDFLDENGGLVCNFDADANQIY